MKENEFLDGLNNIEPDTVERFVSMDNRLHDKLGRSKNKNIWLRIGALAACLALIVSAVVVVKNLKSNGVINPPDDDIPSVSMTTNGNRITGKQALVYGDPSSESEGEADMLAPGFEIHTVIEAEVIEVLPDTYYYAASYYEPLHVAKLRVVDQIRGEGLPKEIYFSYPYYDANVFDGYERFIMSLEQVGVENYALVNTSQSRVDYFSNMFEVCVTRDLGYGSVIAFNDGRVEESFWEKNNYHTSKISVGRDVFESILDSPESNFYPASRDSTIAEVRSSINDLAKNEDNWHVSHSIYNYVTSDDVFISKEAKAVKSYLEPSKTNVFVYYLTLREDRVIANYTRIINGFNTDETVCINGYNGENGNVTRGETVYTEEDLSAVPDIGEALANMHLSELKPPHINISDEMIFSHSNASGIYRKVDGKVYGIIRVLWYYKYPDIKNAYQKDDMYYLYDESGKGSIIERDELKNIIGDDYFIQRFSYDSMIAWD